MIEWLFVSHLSSLYISWRVCLLYYSIHCTRPFWSCCISQIQPQSAKRRQLNSFSVRQYFPWNKNSFVFPCWAVCAPLTIGSFTNDLNMSVYWLGSFLSLVGLFIKGGYVRKVTPFVFFFCHLPQVPNTVNSRKFLITRKTFCLSSHVHRLLDLLSKLVFFPLSVYLFIFFHWDQQGNCTPPRTIRYQMVETKADWFCGQ